MTDNKQIIIASDTNQSAEEYLKKDVTLPQWLLDNLPDFTKHYCLKYNADSKFYVLTHPDGTIQNFSDILSAYDYARSRNHDVLIDENVPEYNNGFIFVPHDGMSQIIFSNSYDMRLNVIKDTYKMAMLAISNYKKNRNDFLTAYNFINLHPAFWVKYKNGMNNNVETVGKTFGWKTSHASSILIEPAQEPDGSIIWRIETGGHVPPDYSEHYYDFRLDAEAATVEECFIQLANKVYNLFSATGVPLEE